MARKEVSDDFKVFSERLSILMKERNLKQKDLADYLGVKRQTVSLYMTGQSMPDAELLKKIAVYFEVSADWILGLSDVKMVNADVQSICRYTGLSEESIDYTHRLKVSQQNDLLFILNTLFGWETFDVLINTIQEIRELQKSRIEYGSFEYEAESSAIEQAQALLDAAGVSNYEIIDRDTLMMYKQRCLEGIFAASMDILLYSDSGPLNMSYKVPYGKLLVDAVKDIRKASKK
ncbi:helix-turn-helix domain-containing protein [Flavonifractor porci]|uniref:helix-turn-helix domain-containing protein n=1 Tax=Flavonifractor porci TaxID=3133422 RepID=UPI003098E0A4